MIAAIQEELCENIVVQGSLTQEGIPRKLHLRKGEYQEERAPRKGGLGRNAGTSTRITNKKEYSIKEKRYYIIVPSNHDY